MALKRLPDVDLSCYPWNEVPLVKDRADSETGRTRIKDVGLRAQHVNLKARVVEKSGTKKVYSRFGDSHDLSTAVISDSTGSIKLPLWNAQIGMVSVGDTVQIENGRVKTFRGELQVSVGKRGKLNVIERTN
jgi:replication factor A1